jgi:nucleoside-diphosphate-sugar epimerase
VLDLYYNSWLLELGSKMGSVSDKERSILLVTGATGNVGKELVEQLVSVGQSVRILVRDPSKIPEDWRNDRLIEPAIGDLDKSESLKV